MQIRFPGSGAGGAFSNCRSKHSSKRPNCAQGTAHATSLHNWLAMCVTNSTDCRPVAVVPVVLSESDPEAALRKLKRDADFAGGGGGAAANRGKKGRRGQLDDRVQDIATVHALRLSPLHQSSTTAHRAVPHTNRRMHTALFAVLSCSWLPASVIRIEFIVSHETAQLNVATDLQEASSGQWLLRPSSVDEWISWLFLQKVERNLDAENFYLQVCALC